MRGVAMSPFCTELTRLKVLYFIGVGAPIKWSKLVSSLRGTTNMTLYGQRHFITLSIPIWIGHVHILYHPKAYATTSPRSLSQWGNEPATRYATRSILNLPSLGLLPFSCHLSVLNFQSRVEAESKQYRSKHVSTIYHLPMPPLCAEFPPLDTGGPQDS